MDSIKALIIHMMSWSGWNMIGNLLTAIGAITLCLTFLRLIHDSRLKKWNANVSIHDYPFDYDVEMNEYHAIYSSLWNNDLMIGNTIIFKPINCMIPTLKVVSLDEQGRSNQTIEVYHNLTPNDSVCFRLERAECLPRYKIKWYSNYGEYSEHFFLENMRNGMNGMDGTIYHATALSTLRRIFGFK